MVLVMSSTLVFTFLATGNIKAVVYSGTFMALVAIWAWRYPGSLTEYNRRVDSKERIAWLK